MGILVGFFFIFLPPSPLRDFQGLPDSEALIAASEALSAASKAFSAVSKGLSAASKAPSAASASFFFNGHCPPARELLPYHYQNNIRFNFTENNWAEGTDGHVKLF